MTFHPQPRHVIVVPAAVCLACERRPGRGLAVGLVGGGGSGGGGGMSVNMPGPPFVDGVPVYTGPGCEGRRGGGEQTSVDRG